MGEVAQPGAVPLKGPMTVLQALAVAGGFKDFANPRNIRILRRNARPRARRDDLRSTTRTRSRTTAATSFYLVEGDTVVVP